ncbi:MAG: GIY-YIG nuclease family protein [Candidatus Doudnabacteria bacterium]|nr:GIY-YIG nuclease family protein [Candidatus Doudnabacteria bacterium]
MYTVYVLRDKDGKLYKGMTKDLERRLKEHKYGHT